MNQFYVYALVAPGREKGETFYIGKGKGRRRFSHFKPTMLAKIHPKNSILKKYSNCYSIILQNNLTEEEAFNLEKELIGFLEPQLANLTNGGDGVSGYNPPEEVREKHRQNALGSKNNFYGRRHTEETKAKLREAQRGKKASEETKAKMREQRKNISAETRQKQSESRRGEKHYNYGQSVTQEIKDKISSTRRELGISHSEESKLKISESKTGKPKSDEHKKNLSKSLLGKKKSDEHKKNLSESHKGKILSKEHKNKISESLKGKFCSSEKSDKISVKAKVLSASKGNKISEYKGITWCKDRNKWRASIYFKGKTHFVGYFDDDVVAFEKYNEFKKTLYEQQPQEQ